MCTKREKKCQKKQKIVKKKKIDTRDNVDFWIFVGELYVAVYKCKVKNGSF